MKILLVILIFGFLINELTAAKSKYCGRRRFFKPNFGKQEKLYKVVVKHCGFVTKRQLKPLGPLPAYAVKTVKPKIIKKNSKPKCLQPKKTCGKKLQSHPVGILIKSNETIEQFHPEEYKNTNLEVLKIPDYSTATTDEIYSNFNADYEEWFAKDLESEGLFLANSAEVDTQESEDLNDERESV